MKLRSKETYWLLKNGLINTYPSLRQDSKCDVLIIGGGITGALMAYQFSQEGYKTMLIDKRDIAMGSTAATTAMLQYEIDEPLYKLINKVGEDAAVDSYREGVAAIQKIEKIVKKIRTAGDFEKKRSLYIAVSDEDEVSLHKEFVCRKKFGFDVSWLTRTQLRKQFGMIGEGAILSDAGATMDAYQVTHALLAYSVEHYGLHVFDHTDAETVEYNTDHNVVITDDNRRIRCRYTLYATGYETHQLFGNKVVDLNSTYALVSEPIDAIPLVLQKTIFWNTEQPYLYMRVTSDNRILVGGGDEKFKNAVLRDALIDKKENYLLAKIEKLLPGLSLIPDFTWAGTFGVTKDALPYMGMHSDYPNSFFVLGFGGNGITFSVMGMRILSDAVAGRSNKFLEYYRFNR